MNISLLDWLVVAAYFVFIAGIGIYVGLRVKDTSHYFLGNRKFGRWLMMGQSFGVGTHAEMPVSLAGAVYQVGASGIWYQWKNLFVTPFLWIMAPVLRRFRRTTMAEVMEDRYGPWMGGVYIVFALAFFTLESASMLKGAAKVIDQATGGGIGPDRIIFGMTVAYLVYSFVGGLVAAAWTDFFQGFLIVVLSFMLVPLGFAAVGGPAGIGEALSAAKLTLAAPEGIGLWMIVALTINGLVGIMSQPHMIASVGTGKTEKTCREGFFYGMWVKRVCTIGWALVGLIVAAMVIQGKFGVTTLADPEDAFGFACRHLLFPGGLGLLIASILAANMSTCSAFMVDSGALFTQGLYSRRIAPGRPDRHYLLVGRLSGVAIAIASVIYAYLFIDRVLYSFLLSETLATYMGICVLGGIVWPRANRWGALASLVVSIAVNFTLYSWMGKRLDSWDPNVFLFSLAAGTAALVIASLATPPEPEVSTALFFKNLETSTDEPSAKTGKDGGALLLVNMLNLRRGARGKGIYATYRSDLNGFAIGWLIAFGLVGGLWLLFKLWF
ncbi:MAG TPA: sodium:solute symporter family protein [Bryobacteraceae bacterium]|nr:sodium:solute symporter family protein [Bryobacteraceae bacterium]